MTDHPRAPEQRTIDVDVGDLDTRGRTLVGYASVYDVLSHDLGGFRERIAPGAFASVLPDADVRCLLNHDPSQVLGRSRAGTLRLHDEQRGLRFECDLPDSPLGENVRASVKRGDIDGASFRFSVGEEDWNGDVRTVKTVASLEDVTVATYGAYPDASVELRARPSSSATSATAPQTPAPDQDRDEPKETPVKTEDRTEGGGLAVEDRAAAADTPTIEDRVRDAMFSIRKGESRSLTTTSAAAIAPPELASYVFDRLRASSVALASGIQVISTDRDSIQWPKISADVTPGWYQEGQAITPSDPTLVTLTATPRKLAALVQFSNEVIDDSVPSVLDTMNAHVTKILALKLDLSVFEGSGIAPEPGGLRNISGIQTLSMGTNGAAISGLDTFADAFALLEAANAKPGAIVMSPRTWNSVRKQKASTGEYLLDDEPGGPGAAVPPRLFGVPVYITSQLSTTEVQGTSGSVASSIYVYDPSQVVLVRRSDATLELDRSRLFNQDMSELRGKARATVLAPNPTAIVRITGVL